MENSPMTLGEKAATFFGGIRNILNSPFRRLETSRMDSLKATNTKLRIGSSEISKMQFLMSCRDRITFGLNQ